MPPAEEAAPEEDTGLAALMGRLPLGHGARAATSLLGLVGGGSLLVMLLRAAEEFLASGEGAARLYRQGAARSTAAPEGQPFATYRTALLDEGLAYGYSRAQTLAVAEALARGGGAQGLGGGRLTEVLRFARGLGMDVEAAGARFAALERLGVARADWGVAVPGSAGGGLTTQELARALAGALQQGGLRGREDEFLRGLERLTAQLVDRTLVAGDTRQTLGMLTALNQTGLPGARGERGAELLSRADRGLAEMSGEAETLLYQAWLRRNPGGDYVSFLLEKELGLQSASVRQALGDVSQWFGGSPRMQQLVAARLLDMPLRQVQPLLEAGVFSARDQFAGRGIEQAGEQALAPQELLEPEAFRAWIHRAGRELQEAAGPAVQGLRQVVNEQLVQALRLPGVPGAVLAGTFAHNLGLGWVGTLAGGGIGALLDLIGRNQPAAAAEGYTDPYAAGLAPAPAQPAAAAADAGAGGGGGGGPLAPERILLPEGVGIGPVGPAPDALPNWRPDVPPETSQRIDPRYLYRTLRANGVDDMLARIMVAAAYHESGLDLRRYSHVDVLQTPEGLWPQSVGLWQLHEGGEGEGLTIPERFDLRNQLARMIPAFQRAYALWRDQVQDPLQLAGLVAAYAEKPTGFDIPGGPVQQQYMRAFQVINPLLEPAPEPVSRVQVGFQPAHVYVHLPSGDTYRAVLQPQLGDPTQGVDSTPLGVGALG